MGSVQVAKGTSITVTETFSVDGTPADLDSGVPSVVAKFPDGSSLTPAPIASGTWTGRTTGQYRIVLDGQAEVTYLDPITWTGTIGGKQQVLYSRVEWVGAMLFTLAELRAFKVGNGYPFAENAVPLFSNRQLMDARAAVLDEFEDILGFSPVPRYAREVHDGDGSGTLLLRKLMAHRDGLLSVKINGAAQVVGDYSLRPSGMLRATSDYVASGTFTAGADNVAVEYRHGWTRVEGIGRDAAMAMAAKILQPSGFSNATTVTTPDGVSYSYVPSEMGRGGYRRYTGIRDLDEWLNRRSEAGLAVA